MVTTIEKKTKFIEVAQLDELTRDLLQVAVHQTQIKLPVMLIKEQLETLFKNNTFLDLFKYTLAEVVAAEIAKNDSSVQTIHLYEPSMNPDTETGDYLPIDPCLHLLCVVEKRSAGLEAFIDAINRALTKEAKELPSPMYKNLSDLLNIMLITPKDIEKRTGYALMLSSLYAPPLLIWKK
jgi:hypothetical protein